MKAIRIFALVALACMLTAGSKKPTVAVRFHVESVGNAGGSFTIAAKFANPPREGFIESVPFASERNIVAIFPVQNPDGTLGCAFQLDKSGALGLETVSKDRRGASMVVIMSTKGGTHQVIDLVIDKPIMDGIIFVPRGVSPGELQVLQQNYPMMGQAKGKQTAKKKGGA